MFYKNPSEDGRALFPVLSCGPDLWTHDLLLFSTVRCALECTTCRTSCYKSRSSLIPSSIQSKPQILYWYSVWPHSQEEQMRRSRGPSQAHLCHTDTRYTFEYRARVWIILKSCQHMVLPITDPSLSSL